MPSRLLVFLIVIAGSLVARAQPLPGTKPLKFAGDDLSEWVMDGAHAFVERKITEATTNRARFWKFAQQTKNDARSWIFDPAAQAARDQALAPNRDRLKQILGVVDQRLPARLERFGDDLRLALVAKRGGYTVYQIRWDVLPGYSAEGLLVEPAATATANAVLIPDADTVPEDIINAVIGSEPDYRSIRRAIEQNARLVILTPVSRAKIPTEDRRLKRSDQTYREWIYRQAFHMGRHIIGYEVQAVLAAVDWFEKNDPDLPIGMAGHGEGGMIAFYAGALDRRVHSTSVGGYFGPTAESWREPIYRNVWGLHREFGVAEIKMLYGSRKVLLSHGAFPVLEGHKGELWKPRRSAMSNEWQRITNVVQTGATFSWTTADGREPPILDGWTFPPRRQPLPQKPFGSAFLTPSGKPEKLNLSAKVRDARHQRIFQGMETHVQNLVRQSEHVRDKRFLLQVLPELNNRRWTTLKTHPLQKADQFIKGAKAFRKEFNEEAMGKFDETPVAPMPRSRQIAETDKWTAYDVVLQVYPELIAWGALVLPKDLKPDEKRPVVVCQHGRNGVPLDTVNRNKTAYNDFAAKLAERGFITFAPHNLYRGEDRYRWLDRKANTIKASLFSFIIAQHQQTLDWLGSLPYVDADRIAFYGLSYGGESAVRLPTVLEGYSLSICSGDFNQWTRKVAATDLPFSFMRTIEWEMPYWNLGHTFDYAEMAYLMIPRPFMVERGHHDGVGRDQWVAHEYAKVRWLFAQLGLADKTEIEYFQGGHSINGESTFDFLHKHLGWPKR
jgi:cephalosporin-C deacetylase-like acetyl esterase